MHPIWLVVLFPALTIPGVGDPGAVGATDPPGPVQEAAQMAGLAEANASAQVNASAAGVHANVSTDDVGLFLHARLPGPGISHPAEDTGAAVEASPVGSEPSEQGDPIPVQLPEPSDPGAAAGLAAVGALAYAAFRLRTIGPWFLLPLYSRLSDSELLDNDVRARLHEVITQEPGLSLQELSERVDAGWGNTVYHLQRLEQAGFVKSEKQGHHRRFYKAGDVDGDTVEALGMLRNDNPKQIAEYIVDNPGSNQKEVCEALEISPSLAHKWIKRLQDQDLVTAEREWRSKHYTPDERLADLVEQTA